GFMQSAKCMIVSSREIRLLCRFMSKPACPMCEMTEVLEFPERWECVTCGHEWERAPEPEAPAGPRVVKDAHGNVLSDGDCVILYAERPHKGSSYGLKGVTKSKPIRHGYGDRGVSCKMDGISIGLKACVVKKS